MSNIRVYLLMEIHTSVMDEKIAEGISSHWGLGLARLLERQINIHHPDADKVSSQQGGEDMKIDDRGAIRSNQEW